MLIYEVNLKIDPTIATAYLAWLKPHIQEIQNLPGFTHAILLENSEKENPQSYQLIVQYHLDSQAALDNYLTNYATQMRADGINKFKDKFVATRRILEIIEEFK